MRLFCNPNFHTTVDPRRFGIGDEEAKVSRFQSTRKLWGARKKAEGDIAAIEMAAE